VPLPDVKVIQQMTSLCTTLHNWNYTGGKQL